MKRALYFVFIIFLEATCGIMLGLFYFMLSSILFDKEGFGGSKANEALYYLFILLPPSLYCWTEYLRFKREGDKSNSIIYLYAGIVYFIGGFIFLLVSTGFYLLG